jgi:membrane-associated phospholipid phosphatase
MFRAIEVFDTHIFYFLNVKWNAIFLDNICPFLRDRYFWIPLYMFLFSFLIINFKKKGLLIILFLVITVIISDQLSSSFIKPLIHRTRPCNTQMLEANIRVLVPCNSSYSFPSSHAANHFAVAVFLIVLFRRIFKKIYIPLILWAVIICYSQVYVGLHYPLDVVGGAALGSLIGWLTARSSRKILQLDEDAIIRENTTINPDPL